MKLLENTNINKKVIKLKKGKQLLNGLIYNLGSVELEILKTYIKTNLKIVFIQLCKSPPATLLLFNQKPNSSFWLYINYWGFNNLTIKNQYLLPLIDKPKLDQLDKAKQFI